MNVNKTIQINYRRFLKLAGNIQQYNFKSYAFRKIKHDFRNVDLNKVGANHLKENYDQLHRIVVVQNLYSKHEDIKERKYSEH
jgi:hydrogenase maturation factor